MLMMSRPTPPPDPYDDEQRLTIKQVSQLLQLGEQTIRNKLDRGKFPRPVIPGRWRRRDILDWDGK